MEPAGGLMLCIVPIGPMPTLIRARKGKEMLEMGKEGGNDKK